MRSGIVVFWKGVGVPFPVYTPKVFEVLNGEIGRDRSSCGPLSLYLCLRSFVLLFLWGGVTTNEPQWMSFST